MSVLVRAGRAAIVKAIKDQALHVAWGTGNGSWTTPPAESMDATALLNEIGRRTVTSAQYVVPDNAGLIDLGTAGKFTVSSTPTHQLYVRCAFDFGDGGTATIREIALFMATVTNPALPGGQRYFLPADLVSAGIMLQLENRVPFTLSVGTRPEVKMLITI